MGDLDPDFECPTFRSDVSSDDEDHSKIDPQQERDAQLVDTDSGEMDVVESAIESSGDGWAAHSSSPMDESPSALVNSL